MTETAPPHATTTEGAAAAVEPVGKSSLERFQIQRQLGVGGMGMVFEAYDVELRRRVALKVLQPSADGRQAQAPLLHEARAMAQLSHPSLVPVFDVGMSHGGVFIAMELVEGGTLRDWLAAAPRSWRVVLDQMVAAGRGLAAAHDAGIVHRDFKPENILIGRDGRARVGDFGLARRSESADLDSVVRAAGMTVPGATASVGGTPGYVAPEVLHGVSDTRSDQFAFCVTLYEALYGERPFAARDDDPFDPIRRGIAQARRGVSDPARDRGVPAWLRRIVVRGLAAEPAARWPSMTALLDELERVPRRRRRRIGLAWLAGVVAAAAVVLYVATSMAAQRAHDRRVDAELARGVAEARRGGEEEARAGELRRTALDAFDRGDVDVGEQRWAAALATAEVAEAARSESALLLEAASVLDRDREDVRDQLAKVLYDRAVAAERWSRPFAELLRRLALHDRTGAYQRAWQAPATLVVGASSGAGATVELLRFEQREDGVLVPVPVRPPVATPARWTSLPIGSYLIRVALDRGGAYAYPVLLGRGTHVDVALPAPPVEVPPGFVFIPAGEVMHGSDAPEEIRQFFFASPLHPRHVPSFVAAVYETTFAEWIEYLEALPPAERVHRMPRSGQAAVLAGHMALRETDDGWTLSMQITTELQTVRAGEPLRFPGRTHHVEQDWLRTPVTGVSQEDARAYAAWLDATGRVPGARLCSELEWERAARGADARGFPHGNGFAPGDANVDETYGRDPLGYGPDEVGSHPAAVSVFGVHDLAGNVFEWIDSPDAMNLRGGSYYTSNRLARIENEQPSEPTMRLHVLGLRICGDAR